MKPKNSPKEKIVSSRISKFENGSYSLSICTDGTIKGSFRPGLLAEKNGKWFPKDYPFLGKSLQVPEMREDNPDFYDEDCPKLTQEELERLGNPDLD